ncbi:amidohydrolase family protein, partial [Stachybotrys elegans]
ALAACSSKLLRGGTIIAFDEESEALRIVRNGALLITDDRIVGIYDTPMPDKLPPQTEKIDVSNQIITPGFIDTHRHGWQTIYKTLASTTTLPEYLHLGQALYAASGSQSFGNFTDRDVYLGQLTGLWESLNGGVTTSLDYAHHTWSYGSVSSGIKATLESEARVFWAYGFQNLPGYGIKQQIPDFRNIAESSMFSNSPVELCIAYDGWSPNPDEAEVNQIVSLAREYRVSAITTHSLGGPWVLSNRPTDLERFGILNDTIPVVFAHSSFLDENDHAILQKLNHYISTTTESEMHYGHTHPLSHLMQDRASLGVDTPFTFSSDILTQARIWLQATRQLLFDTVLQSGRIPAKTTVDVAHVFQLATRAGGLALRRPDLGVIQVGAKADIIVWNARESPSMLGWVDPVAAVILHASVGDVLDVMVDGKFVKRNGKILAQNYDSIRSEFVSSGRKIQEDWMRLQRPTLEGKWLGVTPYGYPQHIAPERSQIVQGRWEGGGGEGAAKMTETRDEL